MPLYSAATSEIYEATTAKDGSGGVYKGARLTQGQAEVRRKAGLDIVVCGPDAVDNRLLAGDIEAAIGPWQHQKAHERFAGPLALPHYQQRGPLPVGHSFYETAAKKAI